MVVTGAVRSDQRHGRWSVAVSVAALLVLAGCSSSGGSDDGTPSQQAPSESTSPGEAAATDGGGAAVGLGSTSLGDVLVDADGLTLYMYDNDTQGSDSTCYDQCASAWPPLLTEGDPVPGDGLDAAMLGTAERTDGTTQVTYGGWPLYYWAQDATAGDVNGQGVNGVWWVLGADGQPIHG